MSRHAIAIAVAAALAALAGGVLTALAPAILPSPQGLLVGAGFACYLVFLVWPWFCIPVGILGGAIVAGQGVPGDYLPWIVAIHGGILLAGALAMLSRWLVAPGQPRWPRTAADPFMLALLAAIVLAAGYGLARGNAPYRVMVATYELAIIPAYFFLATASLRTPRAVRAAAVTFVGALVALGLAQLAGRPVDLGLFAALALTPVLAGAAGTAGWRRAGLLAVGAILAAEVMLSQYRTVWVASGLAVLILLVRGSARIRMTAAFTLAAGGLTLAGAAALDGGVAKQWAAVVVGIADPPGYREAETVIGLRVLAEHPLLAAGLGQITPHIYVEGFKVTDVGPIYHMFWMIVLANAGLVGLLAILAPLLLAAGRGLTARSDPALGFAATLCGFLASAAFAGPADGHWELGLLAALTLLAQAWKHPAAGSANTSVRGSAPCPVRRAPARSTPVPV
jgi:hypothetical protein